MVLAALLTAFSALGSTAQASDPGSLIHYHGTYYVVTRVEGGKQVIGFTSEEAFKSWGYKYSEAKPADAEDLVLISQAGAGGGIKLRPGIIAIDTNLASTPWSSTVYIVGSDGCKYAFTSGQVFEGLGFNYKNVQKLNLSQFCDRLSPWDKITSVTDMHPPGSLVIDKLGTVYWMGRDGYQSFTSVEAFLSYGLTFDQVVPANNADISSVDYGPVSSRSERYK